MKKLATLLCCLAIVLALPALADDDDSRNPNLNPMHHFQDKDHDGRNDVNNFATPGGSGQLRDHGGPVMTSAHVVYIFWGWASNTSDPYVQQTIAFRNSANGMVKHMGMLSQYRSAGPAASLKGSQADVFDAVPPTALRVTDVMVQREVAKFFNSSFAANTVYEVFIPSSFFSDDGSGATSCGGTNLQYCAYHSSGDGTNLNANAKYSIQPYPSCSGCHGMASWTAANDQQHFTVHETREALSDPLGTGFWDRAGFEADDKCAWGTNLAFLFSEVTSDGTFAYQMEYSNSARNCVK